jgi:hypothetical protein
MSHMLPEWDEYYTPTSSGINLTRHVNELFKKHLVESSLPLSDLIRHARSIPYY